MNNKRHGQDKDNERLFWNKVASERIYAAFDLEEYLLVFKRAMGDNLEGKFAVDVGCASGISAALLASMGANRVLGVDISPELIRNAREQWKDLAHSVTFTVGDAENLDIEAGSADICFFGGVLHHFPRRDKVYEEALRILKPQGRFVALEPNRLDFLERIEWAIADLRGKLSPNEFPIDPRVMQRELQDFGFVDSRFWTLRQDIPFLAQFPGLSRFFSRQKGFWLKRPLLHVMDALRAPSHRGTFFVMEAQKRR